MSGRPERVCTGILVDVSKSMKAIVKRPSAKTQESWSLTGIIQRLSAEKEESWSRSIFRAVDDLITNDVRPENETFAIAFGASKTHVIFDLLTTLQKLSSPINDERKNWDLRQIVSFFVDDLENNSEAKYIRSWADVDSIVRNITKPKARILLGLLENDEFKRRFVKKCLPKECRDGGGVVARFAHSGVSSSIAKVRNMTREYSSDDSWFGWGRTFVNNSCARIGSAAGSVYETGVGVNKSIKEVVQEGIDLALELCVSAVNSYSSLIGIHEAQTILKRYKQDEKLSDTEIDDLTESVESYIYGDKPMMAALNQAREILQYSTCEKRLLFLLSDGDPSDSRHYTSVYGIYIVCCYITNQHIADSKRLYSEECSDWNDEAKFLFRLSSTVATDTIPLEVFRKRNWKVDTSNNATKLFFQVNNPDLIQEVCDFAKELVCEEGKLPGLLADVKQHVSASRPADALEEQVRDQGENSTCYAHAIASTVQHNTSNVENREGGCPDAGDMANKMIRKYGKAGAYTAQVLKEICPQYRLQCSETPISEAQAKEAIVNKQAVVARFEYTAEQENAFKEFFDQFPLGILDKADLPDDKGKKYGHAVVLVAFNASGLKFLNSWGDDFADAGFFCVKNSKVLGMQFYDVSAELTPSEQVARKNEGRKWAQSAMTLITAKKATFQCPLCDVTSSVSEFTGSLLRVKCPSCRDTFDPKDYNCFDVILTTHLTSITPAATNTFDPKHHDGLDIVLTTDITSRAAAHVGIQICGHEPFGRKPNRRRRIVAVILVAVVLVAVIVVAAIKLVITLH